MMSDDEVRKIAETLITEDDSRFTYEFIGINRRQRFPNELNVLFTPVSPEGERFDGPVIVIVDEVSETARFFNNF